MPLIDQMKSLERDRDTLLDAIEQLVTTAEGESRAFTDEETKKHAELKAQVDDKVKRHTVLHDAVEMQKLRLVKQLPANDDDGARGERGTHIQLLDPPKLAPGIKMARYVQAIGAAKGNLMQAHEISKRWKDSSPELEMILRAAVTVGTTTDATWASALVPYKVMADEFVNLLYPQTIIGQLPLRKVPFNVRIPRMTAGASAGWVGEGKLKPVSKGAFDTVSVPYNKLAVISVLTEELLRFSNPSAEMVVRDMLINAIATALNQQFIDPAAGGVAGIKPPSITNGLVIPGPAAYTPNAIRAAASQLIAGMVSKNYPMEALRFIMNPVLAVGMESMRTAQDVAAFPEMQQGKLLGVPFITSNTVPITDQVAPTPDDTPLIIVASDYIFLADDGQVTIDVSREATVEMSTDPETDTGTQVSLWQSNCVGILAERYVTWAKAKADAVQAYSIALS